MQEYAFIMPSNFGLGPDKRYLFRISAESPLGAAKRLYQDDPVWRGKLEYVPALTRGAKKDSKTFTGKPVSAGWLRRLKKKAVTIIETVNAMELKVVAE